MKEEVKRFYHPELDGLRFFAFLLVFLNHAPYFIKNNVSRIVHEYGWIGVDVFLCLSAYLITKLLIEEYKHTKNISFKFFLIRRALKIWPLYFIFVLFSLVYSIVNQIDGFSWVRLFGLLTFTDNILSVVFNEYNHMFATVHLWTISYEWQIYVIIPLLARFLINQDSKNKLLILLTLLFGGNVIRAIFILFTIEHPAIWVFPLTHFESVIAGIALAYINPIKYTSAIRSWIFFLAGIICLIATTSLPNIENTDWSLMAMYPMIGLGTGLIVLSISSENAIPISKLLRQKHIAFLGKTSYGLYVYHILALFVTDYLYKTFINQNNPNSYTATMITAGLLITIIFSTISYFSLEKPFLKIKEKYSLVQSRPS